jgi:hypothetical protein
MIVSKNVSTDKTKYTYKIELEESDTNIAEGQVSGKNIELYQYEFSFKFPKALKSLHPDLEACALLTIVKPWINKRITLPCDVSSHFAQIVKQEFGVHITNINSSLKKRLPRTNPGLSFSGGVDSIATYLIMPKNTVGIFCARMDHHIVGNSNHNYNPQAQIETLKNFKNSKIVFTDLEHIVKPFPQYPTWVALSSPCLFLADDYDLNSIAYGSILAADYIHNGEKFNNYNKKQSGWFKLFSAVGTPISKPVNGLSEIGTAIITENNNLTEIATSCAYGTFKHPCMKCKKCFRKYLITTAIRQEVLSKETIDTFLAQKQIQQFILDTNMPIYCQHTIMWALNSLNLNDFPILKCFKRKIFFKKINIDFLNRYYKPSLNNTFPKKIRKNVKTSILQYIQPMNKKMEKNLENWDLKSEYENLTKLEIYKLKRINKRIGKLLKKEGFLKDF